MSKEIGGVIGEWGSESSGFYENLKEQEVTAASRLQ